MKQVPQLGMVILIAALGGCSNSALNSKISEAENHIRDLSVDPNSVEFRNVEYFDDKGVVCGQANFKNRFGGYTGFTEFFVSDSTSGVLPDENDSNSDFGGHLLKFPAECLSTDQLAMQKEMQKIMDQPDVVATDVPHSPSPDITPSSAINAPAANPSASPMAQVPDTASTDYDEADTKLTTAYETVMGALSRSDKIALRNGERAWIAARNDACGFETKNPCALSWTQRRTDYLEFLISKSTN